MQLFITPYIANDTVVTLAESRVVEQLTRVLRAKIGDRIMVQLPVYIADTEDGSTIVRHICTISAISKSQIEATIIETKTHIHVKQTSILGVAMTNKFEKIELIVQKATEIGLEHMEVFPSFRSQLREVSESKMIRLQKIILEAVEQSYGRTIPSVTYNNDILSLLHDMKCIVLHQGGKSRREMSSEVSHDQKKIYLVGPEGGRSSEDEKMFADYNVEYVSLGSTILRTETAAIVVAWELVR